MSSVVLVTLSSYQLLQNNEPGRRTEFEKNTRTEGPPGVTFPSGHSYVIPLPGSRIGLSARQLRKACRRVTMILHNNIIGVGVLQNACRSVQHPTQQREIILQSFFESGPRLSQCATVQPIALFSVELSRHRVVVSSGTTTNLLGNDLFLHVTTSRLNMMILLYLDYLATRRSFP